MKNLVLSILIAQGILLALPSYGQTQMFGKNLLKNGNAELGQGSADGSCVNVPGWTVSDQLFTVVKYGGRSDVLLPDSPGPAQVGVNARGKNFFAGGNGAATEATQDIDLSSIKDTVDTGKVKFDLSGWLGGYESQNDNALVNVIFFDEEGNGIKDATIGPVLARDRAGKTALLFKKAIGVIPAGARKAHLTMKITRTAGTFNDGYADHIALTLIAPPTKEASGK